MKHGKKYVESAKLVDKTKLYDPAEALEVAVKTATAKFDETVEAHIRLALTPAMRISRFAARSYCPTERVNPCVLLCSLRATDAKAAQEAGAEFVGAEELVAKIQGEGWMDFDVAIAAPNMMGLVGRLGKVLGPRGLMPSPKAGTVTPDVAKAVTEAKAGKIEYRLDKTNIIHCPIGKVSFGAEKLNENFSTLLEAIIKAKPAATKGQYIRSCVVATTMGPGVRINANRVGGAE